MAVKYHRVLLKLSGEALSGEKGFGLDVDTIQKICSGIQKAHELGAEIAIVVGGGNFWRGRASGEMERTRADHMGMLATAMNALAVADALEHLGLTVRVPEIDADIIFKATMVDGVYDKDPKKHPDAKKYDRLTFSQVLADKLAVMDSTAATMCRDNDLPILVFDISDPDNIARALEGQAIGTLVAEQ